MGNVRASTETVFPGLKALVPQHRYERVDNALQSLFTKTLQYMDDGLPFIITGDISAMWLRDSTWQVKPLLASNNLEVKDLLINLSRSQVKLFLKDPYANAFNPAPTGACWHKDFTDQSPWVFERKFELDSWASILYLARKIEERYGTKDHLDSEFLIALELMFELSSKEQHHNPDSYIFFRDNGVPHDSLSDGGRGAPTRYTGMVYSAFRPSDDACRYGYLIPSNIFFKSELEKLTVPKFQSRAQELGQQIAQGIKDFAIGDGVLAYEVDGLGNSIFMDDANVPSLLSLPYLEALSSDDLLYQKTRSFVLSDQNPFFYSGKIASGIGSQHTPKNQVWPIAIAMAALTTADQSVKLGTLELLEATDASTGRMHESFHVDDDHRFTRDWFSWSDMVYVDLVLSSVNFKD